jgi:hypothetical protein
VHGVVEEEEDDDAPAAKEVFSLVSKNSSLGPLSPCSHAVIDKAGRRDGSVNNAPRQGTKCKRKKEKGEKHSLSISSPFISGWVEREREQTKREREQTKREREEELSSASNK